MSGSARAFQYVADVASARVDVCRQARQAVDRHVRDMAASERGELPYRFDREAADRAVAFVEMLPHVKGRFRGLLRLEPWQCFLLSSVFGWQDSEGLRRFRTAYVEVPRKNAKSTLSAGVALYMMLADGEPGAEVYTVATGMDQARIVYDTARQMVERTRQLRSAFGITVVGGRATSGRMIADDGSVFRPLARDMKGNLDGLNVHCAVIDELHGHKTRDEWEVMETATGARSQPLVWAITTAGTNRASVCYEQRGYVERILSGDVRDDTYFGLVYTLDSGDDWREEATWRKANPNYGVSVMPDDIGRKAAKARALASAQNGFLTKHLDVWVNAAVSWLNMDRWEACRSRIDPADFEGRSVWIGLDLSKRIDLAAVSYLWQGDDGRLYSKVRYYLPSETIEQSDNALYAGWARDGHIVETPGAKTDFAAIEAQLLEDAERYAVESVAYDAYQAQYLANRLDEAGLPMVEFAQNTGNMSAPTKELEALVLTGEFRHDGSPVTRWCFSNVDIRTDLRDNVFPTRDRDNELAKIDGAVATIMALAVCDPGSAGAHDFYNLNDEDEAA